MKFKIEQFNTLSQWEDHFRTAINAQWARNPGTSALLTIHGIYCQVTGDQRRFNDNCSHCILSLLKDCGTIYFQDKEEMKAKEEEAARIAAQQAKEAEEASSQEQPVQEEQPSPELKPSENAESAQGEQIPQEEVTDKAVEVSPAPAEPVEKVEIKTEKPNTTTRKPRKPKN